MSGEFEVNVFNIGNSNVSGLDRKGILDRINFLRAYLENTFIGNDLITDSQVINLSQELDEAIIEYYSLEQQ